MVRDTSSLAFRSVMKSGLVSKRRKQVYEYVYKNGPVTCRQAMKDLAKQFVLGGSSFSTRFSELKRQGLIHEVGSTNDPDTGHKSILWDVTNNEPKKLEQPKTKYEQGYDQGFNDALDKVLSQIPEFPFVDLIHILRK